MGSYIRVPYSKCVQGVGVDWIEAARITFHTKALHLDTLKSGRASLQCFHKVGTALCMMG